jgi:Leucine-rich repeat (LRR) protein
MSFQSKQVSIIQQLRDNNIRNISDSVGDQSLSHEQEEPYLDIEDNIADRYQRKGSGYNSNNNSIGRGSNNNNNNGRNSSNRGSFELGTDSTFYDNPPDSYRKLDQTQQQKQQNSPIVQDFAKKKKVLTKQRSAQRLHKMEENNTTPVEHDNDDDGNNINNDGEIDYVNVNDNNDDDEFDLNNDNVSKNRINDDDGDDEDDDDEEDEEPIKSLEPSIPIPTMINIPDPSYQNHMYQPAGGGGGGQYTPFLSGATSILGSSAMYSTDGAMGNNGTNSIRSIRQLSSDGTFTGVPPPMSFPGHLGGATLDRSTSDQSTGSFLYCKTPNSSGIFGKSSSLIFPTGVDNTAGGGGDGSGGNLCANVIGDGADPSSSGTIGINPGNQASLVNGGTFPAIAGTGTPLLGSGSTARQSHHQQQLHRHSNSTVSSSLSTSVSNKVTTIPEGNYEDNSNSNGGIGGAIISSTAAANQAKKASIAMAIDQCENSRGFPFSKKKLILSNLKMHSSDIPLSLICKTPLGNTLYKLDLSNNDQLGSIPPPLVENLPALRILNLSQCSLNALPPKWHLPKLTKLDLSNNRLDFPEEVSVVYS